MKKKLITAALIGVAFGMAVQAQQPPPPNPPPAVPTAPPAATNLVVAPPQIQVQPGTLEAVRAMEGALKIARRHASEIESVFKTNPNDTNLQNARLAAQTAQETARGNLRVAQQVYGQVKRAPLDPQTQATLGTTEVVGYWKAALNLARERSRDADAAWDKNPENSQLQSQLVAAMVAEGTAEYNLKVAERCLSANVGALKAAAKRSR